MATSEPAAERGARVLPSTRATSEPAARAKPTPAVPAVAPVAAAAGPKRPEIVPRKRPKLRSLSDIEESAELPSVRTEAALPARPVGKPAISPTAMKPAVPRPTTSTAKPVVEQLRPTVPELPAVVDRSAGLPASKAKVPITPAVPAPIAAKSAQSFGELDWGLDDDLPAAADLPAPRADLPSRPKLDDLPSRPKLDADLPSRPKSHAALPSRPDTSSISDFLSDDLLPGLVDELPSPVIRDDLPSAARAPLPALADSLPDRADVLPDRAVVLPELAESLPARSEPPLGDPWAAGAGDPLGFGELELPPLPADAEVVPLVDAELPPLLSEPPLLADPLQSAPPFALSEPPPSLGRSDFGELDLGPLLDNPAAPPLPLELPPLAGDAPPAFVGDATVAAPTEERTVRSKRRRTRVALVAAALLLIGGGALELTEYGAFGRLAVADAIHESGYRALAGDHQARFAQATATDLYPGYTGALSALHDAAEANPRAWDLSMFSAYAHALTDLRFGVDPARQSRAAASFAASSKKASPALTALARITREASPNTAATLRAQLAGLSLSGPLLLEAALLDGELALLEGDSAAAIAAFERARGLGATTRASYGLARAKRDTTEGDALLVTVLTESPQHVDARVMQARRQLAADQNEAALETLAGIDARSASASALAAALALRGHILLEDGKTAEARAAFDEAFAKDPQSEVALLGQGEALLQAGRYTEALARFEGAMKLATPTPAAAIGAARAKLKLEASADAIALLTAQLEKTPKDAETHYWLGEVLARTGKSDDALAAFERAKNLYSTNDKHAVLPHLAIARIESQRGEEQKAIATLDLAKRTLPMSVALLRAFGDLDAAGGRYDAAIVHYRAASKLDEKDSAVRLKLAELLRKAGKLDEAKAELDAIAAVDKDFPGLTLERGVLLEQSGKLEEALAEFQRAQGAAPDDLDRVLRVGAAYLAVGRVSDALPLLEKVQRARPDSAEAQHMLGRAQLARGGPRVNESLRLLRRASELDPHNASYQVYVAWAANESSPPQVQVAREAAERALALDKTEADAYWQHGVAFMKEGAFVSAQDDLKKAVALKPDRAEAHASLAECYEGQSLFGQAVTEWRAAIARDPKPAYWRYRYGRLLAERGAHSEAAGHLEYAVTEGEKAEARPGWLTTALFQEAQTFRRIGRNKDALIAFKKYVEAAPASAPDRRDAQAAIEALGGR